VRQWKYQPRPTCQQCRLALRDFRSEMIRQDDHVQWFSAAHILFRNDGQITTECEPSEFLWIAFRNTEGILWADTGMLQDHVSLGGGAVKASLLCLIQIKKFPKLIRFRFALGGKPFVGSQISI